MIDFNIYINIPTKKKKQISGSLINQEYQTHLRE
jgi:hypothetical protein